jgi:hypothetical protein
VLNLYAQLQIIFFILSLVAPNALGVIVKLSDLQTMAAKSDIVFHGYVGDQRVNYDKMGRIITLTDIEVIDGLYGSKPGQIVTMYQVGGEHNGVVMPLLGGHVYRLGQEVILFGLTLKNTFVSFSAGQGKLDIRPGEDEEVVREDLGDISALGPSIDGSLGFSTPVPLTYSNTELLKDEIRLMLRNRL